MRFDCHFVAWEGEREEGRRRTAKRRGGGAQERKSDIFDTGSGERECGMGGHDVRICFVLFKIERLILFFWL